MLEQKGEGAKQAHSRVYTSSPNLLQLFFFSLLFGAAPNPQRAGVFLQVVGGYFIREPTNTLGDERVWMCAQR